MSAAIVVICKSGILPFDWSMWSCTISLVVQRQKPNKCTRSAHVIEILIVNNKSDKCTRHLIGTFHWKRMWLVSDYVDSYYFDLELRERSISAKCIKICTWPWTYITNLIGWELKLRNMIGYWSFIMFGAACPRGRQPYIIFGAAYLGAGSLSACFPLPALGAGSFMCAAACL